jgi:hypothetical protein
MCIFQHILSKLRIQGSAPADLEIHKHPLDDESIYRRPLSSLDWDMDDVDVAEHISDPVMENGHRQAKDRPGM